jgi:TolB-like protein
VMPFIEGESVRDKLDREKQLGVDEAIQITLEVADALSYAHAQNIIHRDIKPENVMMSNGHALVADFGIARARTEAGQNKLTQTGMAVGTPVYMSPEQATGEAVGPSADIYSLGCMLYEMLAGEPPFNGPNAMAIMARHAMEAVPSVRIIRPAVPEEVEEAIFHALEKNVADRPKTAAEFCEILGTPLGATATRKVTGRHTARMRVPTGARMQAFITEEAEVPKPVPLYKRPLVLASSFLGLVAVVGAVWMAFLSGGSASAAVGDAFSDKKIAILYFTDGTGGKLGYLADGLTEAMIDQLKPIRELEVLSKDAVGRFRGVSTDSVRSALEPGTIVKGSVSEDGDQVRVTVNVLNGNSLADKGDPLVFTLPAADPLAVRQRVSDSVSTHLRQLLGTAERARQLVAGTNDQRAWELVQRAERLRKDGAGIAGTDSAAGWLRYYQADSLLAQAEKLDDNWETPIALRAVLSLSQARSAKSHPLRAPYLDEGIAHANRALTQDSTNVDALEARGQLRFARWQTQLNDKRTGDQLLEGAKDDLVRATRLEPTRATAWVALSSVYSQLHDQFSAYQAATRAYEEDAYSSLAEGVMRQMYATAYDIQRFELAQQHCDSAARRFPRNWRFVSCKLTMQATGQIEGTPDSALNLLQRLVDLLPANERQLQTLRHQMLVAAVLGRAKMIDSAHRLIEKSRNSDPKVDPAGNLLTAEALARTQLGTASDTTIAFEKLREYVVTQPLHGKGFADTDHWWWKGLRNDRRWEALRVSTGS